MFSLVRDCAQPFDQRLAFCAVVDHERVVFAMRRPRTTRHFLEIHEPPICDVSWFQSEVIAHSRRNIEAGAFVEIRLRPFVPENVLPMISAEWSGVFPLRICGRSEEHTSELQS